MSFLAVSLNQGLRSVSRSATLQSSLTRTSFLKQNKSSFRQFSSKSNNSGKSREYVKEAEVSSSSSSKSSSSSSSPAKVQSKDAAPKVSSIESFKRDLVKLSDTEIRNIQENQQASLTESDIGDAPSWIQTSGFVLEDKDDSISLTKVTPKYTVEVQFAPYPEGEEGESEGNGLNEDMEEEGGSDVEQEDDGDKEAMKSLPFNATISFNDAQGAYKGRVVFGGEVGGDSRLYVNEIQSTTAPKTEKEAIPAAIFEKLSQDIQDRMYDLLDEVGVDDKMGSYIRHFANNYEDSNSISVLENLKKVLSD